MRTYLPFILVGLAIFTAACVIFIASELTKEAEREGESSDDD